MKTITEKEYWDVTQCTPDFRIGNITLEEAQEFLNRKGYDIIIHRLEQKNLEHRRSVPGTGETESIGCFDTMVNRVLAIKPGTEVPAVYNEEAITTMGFYSVLQRELKKNLLA